MLLFMLIANKILAINKVCGIEGDDKLIEKYKKLSKIGKLFKSQKSAKLEKKLSKSENLSNFDAKKNRPSLLTPNTKRAFNYLC